MKKRLLVAALSAIAALVVVACSDSLSPTSLTSTLESGGAQSLTTRVSPRVCHVAPSGDTRIISPTNRNYRTHVGHNDAPLSPEVCDGIDNDCDGEIDDHIGTVTVSCGEGACYRTVQHSCVDGELTGKQCKPKEPSEEVCDGIDNNCDGSVDEGDACCNSLTNVGAGGPTGPACP